MGPALPPGEPWLQAAAKDLGNQSWPNGLQDWGVALTLARPPAPSSSSPPSLDHLSATFSLPPPISRVVWLPKCQPPEHLPDTLGKTRARGLSTFEAETVKSRCGALTCLTVETEDASYVSSNVGLALKLLHWAECCPLKATMQCLG